jgi:hypothetical protein
VDVFLPTLPGMPSPVRDIGMSALFHSKEISHVPKTQSGSNTALYHRQAFGHLS